MVLFFAGSLACAWALVRSNHWQLAWHISYPTNFQPLNTSRLVVPIRPADAVQETLPDGSVRHLFVFREMTQDSLLDASSELFRMFGQNATPAQAKATLAGQDGLELSLLANDGFVVQRSLLIRGNLFAITFVGDSELTPDDLALFNKICRSLTIHQQS
jgi:hypothetical protein